MLLEFTVQHKYCGIKKTVRGNNVWNALRNNNLDPTYWTVQEVRKATEKNLGIW